MTAVVANNFQRNAAKTLLDNEQIERKYVLL